MTVTYFNKAYNKNMTLTILMQAEEWFLADDLSIGHFLTDKTNIHRGTHGVTENQLECSHCFRLAPEEVMGKFQKTRELMRPKDAPDPLNIRPGQYVYYKP